MFRNLINFPFFFCNFNLADLASSLKDYRIVVPRKVSSDGQHLSHNLEHQHSTSKRRRRAADDDDDNSIHYRLQLVQGEEDKHLHLKPNDRLIAPVLVVERRGRNVSSHRLERSVATKSHCHFIGQVRGHDDSTAAVSTCKGLVSELLSMFLFLFRKFQANNGLFPATYQIPLDAGRPFQLYYAL